MIGALATPSRAGTPGLRLPAPITIETGTARFQIERDGLVRRLPRRVLPFPPDVAWFPGTGVWYAIRHRHLVVGRWEKPLWRSSGEYRARYQFGVVTIGERTVAYSYRRHGAEWLYVSPLAGRERRVARNEFPLGWTRGGFYAYRYGGRQLLLRGKTGALEATVVRMPATYFYDRTTESLYFIARGTLWRAQGAAVKAMASLAGVGLPPRKPDAEIVPLGSLLELLTNGRLIVLHADGTLFAATRLPDPHEAISSEVAVAPDASAVAYTVAIGTSTNEETVYVLRAGARAAIALNREPAELGGCVSGATVRWHGRWLLYSATGGYLAVIDSARKRPQIDLSAIAQRLSGNRNGISAYWSGHGPQP